MRPRRRRRSSGDVLYTRRVLSKSKRRQNKLRRELANAMARRTALYEEERCYEAIHGQPATEEKRYALLCRAEEMTMEIEAFRCKHNLE